LYKKPFSTAGFTGNRFHIMRYKLIWLPKIYLQAFLGRRLKTPLLIPTALVLPGGNRRFHPITPKGAAGTHPSPNEGPKVIPTWGPPWAWSHIPAGLEVLQAAAFPGEKEIFKRDKAGSTLSQLH